MYSPHLSASLVSFCLKPKDEKNFERKKKEKKGTRKKGALFERVLTWLPKNIHVKEDLISFIPFLFLVHLNLDVNVRHLETLPQHKVCNLILVIAAPALYIVGQ